MRKRFKLLIFLIFIFCFLFLINELVLAQQQNTTNNNSNNNSNTKNDIIIIEEEKINNENTNKKNEQIIEDKKRKLEKQSTLIESIDKSLKKINIEKPETFIIKPSFSLLYVIDIILAFVFLIIFIKIKMNQKVRFF